MSSMGATVGMAGGPEPHEPGKKAQGGARFSLAQPSRAPSTACSDIRDQAAVRSRNAI